MSASDDTSFSLVMGYQISSSSNDWGLLGFSDLSPFKKGSSCPRSVFLPLVPIFKLDPLTKPPFFVSMAFLPSSKWKVGDMCCCWEMMAPGSRRRCYSKDRGKSHPNVNNKNELDNFRRQYYIPAAVLMQLTSSDEMNNSPFVCLVGFYHQAFKYMLRLSLYPFAQRFLFEACIVPAQLAPNR